MKRPLKVNKVFHVKHFRFVSRHKATGGRAYACPPNYNNPNNLFHMKHLDIVTRVTYLIGGKLYIIISFICFTVPIRSFSLIFTVIKSNCHFVSSSLLEFVTRGTFKRYT